MSKDVENQDMQSDDEDEMLRFFQEMGELLAPIVDPIVKAFSPEVSERLSKIDANELNRILNWSTDPNTTTDGEPTRSTTNKKEE